MISLLTSLFSINGTNNVSLNEDRHTAYARLADVDVKDVFDSLTFETYDDVFLKNNYSTLYFANLRTNFCNNVQNSCSYVAMGMLLSYYDTYWDDDFVPESFEIHGVSSFETYRDADFSLPSFYAESPGVLFEPNSVVGNQTLSYYQNYMSLNNNYSFQAKLFELNVQYFGLKFRVHPYSMSYSELTNFLGLYAHDYCGFTTNEISVQSTNDSTSIRNFVINKINSGIPVILRASSADLGGHAFIAYDYDENQDEIYVHTGWRDEENNLAATHVALSSIGFTTLEDAFALDLSLDHHHSWNYVSEENETACSCHYSFPRNIVLESGNYPDKNPTFSWQGLKNERWNISRDPSYQLSFLDSDLLIIDDPVLSNSNEYCLSGSLWSDILHSDEYDGYYVAVQLYSSTYPYWDDYIWRDEFQKPEYYLNLPSLSPSDYQFDSSYPSNTVTKEQFVTHYTDTNLEVQTRRFRAGYNDNYLVLSPIRAGYNEAYIEFMVETAITRIDIDVSHWGSVAEELLNVLNGTFVLQRYNKSGWDNVFNFLSLSANLSRNRSNPTHFEIEFKKPTYRFRFYSHYNPTPTNQDDRGRLCIGDIDFYTSDYCLPLSGSELDYNPSGWTSSYNCYAYALNTKNHGYMQPGCSIGAGISYLPPNYLTGSVLTNMVSHDAEHFGFTFVSIGKHERPLPGCYKIALVIAPNSDYHWYRQNSDGTWSHKPGQSAVRRFDYKIHTIYDPELCDRRTPLINYSMFVGYYSVNVEEMI